MTNLSNGKKIAIFAGIAVVVLVLFSVELC